MIRFSFLALYGMGDGLSVSPGRKKKIQNNISNLVGLV